MHPIHSRRAVAAFTALVAIATTTVVPAETSAKSFPDKPVRIIVPYGPAGISDMAARILGAKLASKWGQAVVVENKPGGAGLIGTTAAAQAAPDGYTLLLATVAEFAVTPHMSKHSLEATKGLVPIALLTDTPLVLVANPKAPFNNLRELVAYAKSQPNGLSYASPGVATLNHLTGEYLAVATGIKLVHIPYKGGGQSAAAVVAGEVPMGVSAMSVAKAAIDGGRLRAIGVSSEQRLKSAPEWPTIAESGLPDFVASNWVAVAAPAGTPKAIVAKINTDINDALQAGDVRSQLAQTGAAPVGGKPEALATRIRIDSARYQKVIQAAGLKLEQ